ncbi:MAG: cobalamin biosynthesis protein, partial [Peptostreptococcaceae bacterium]
MNILSIYIGYITDLIVGDPYSFPHPVRYIGNLIRYIEKKIRKTAKTDKQLKRAGFTLWFFTVIPTYLITYLIVKLSSFNIYVFLFVNS